MSNNIKKIQNRLLDIGVKVASILDTHGIPYMITFGTLLGAVRHDGFIPWDDDFDFFLFDDSYESALSFLADELPKDMYLEYKDTEPLYFHGWAHVKDLNTVANCKISPQDNIYSHNGISVDLYKATKMRLSNLDEFLKEEHIKYLERRIKSGSIEKKECIAKIKELRKDDLSSIKQIEDKDIYAFPLPEKYMAVDDVLPLKKYVFEGYQFWGPTNYDNILTSFYGDYMQLPPEEKRTPHYDSVLFLK